MLEFIKNAVLVILGFIAGSSVMYCFELFMDWREEQSDHPLLDVLDLSMFQETDHEEERDDEIRTD